MNIEFRKITKTYKDKVALKDFTLSINNGIIGILAPNGAGKTTLLRILATAIAPSEGEVLLNGKNIISLGKSYRDIIGYLPQNFGVYPNMSIEKFLKYFGALKDVENLDYRIDELLEVISLRNVKKQKLKILSGGMKQRVGIAQALLNNPKILILDEPTVGLDPNERIKFREFLIDISENRMVLLSTHIVSDVEAMATDIIFMREGELISYITPQNALKELEGKVYEVITDIDCARKLRKNGFVSHTKNTIDGMMVRIIDDMPCKNSVLVRPNLEDVYMYYYNSY